MLFKLREWWKPLFVDRTIRALIVASLALNAATWVLLLSRLFSFLQNGRIIALHYNVYLKVNDVGPAYWALLPAAVGTAVVIVNSAFARRAASARRPAAVVILAVTVLYELMALAAGVFIVLINISR